MEAFIFLRFFNGGDVDENRHFNEGNLVAHGQISIFYKNLNDDVVMMMRVYRPFPFEIAHRSTPIL